MFTSEKNSKKVMKTLFIYLGVTAFVMLFSGVYEINSHNVYSASMVFAFRYPLILGVGMYFAMRYLPTSKVPGTLPACIYAFGVAMATVRAIFIGVVDIYGTTNINMVAIYTVLAWIFVIAGVSLYVGILIYGIIDRHKHPKVESFEDEEEEEENEEE